MSKIENNRATLQRWYNEMWGKCNNALIPQIAAPQYLRHDITGANNLMTSEQYRDLVGLGLSGESVKEFEYFLIVEADYVASLGRYVLNSGRQWDWVQLFRLENAAMVETWLPGMGGTDIFGYPQAHNVWTGREVPPALPLTDNKTVVRAWFEDVWGNGNVERLSELLTENFRIHDHTCTDRSVNIAEYQSELRGKLSDSTITDMKLFMIEEGDMVVAVVSWKIHDKQWDFVQAFRLEELRLAETWLPAIGGNDTSLIHNEKTAWGRGIMPSGSMMILNS
jgi:predicted SnoaL-like aldol condensation-catalyzing enzyme